MLAVTGKKYVSLMEMFSYRLTRHKYSVGLLQISAKFSCSQISIFFVYSYTNLSGAVVTIPRPGRLSLSCVTVSCPQLTNNNLGKIYSTQPLFFRQMHQNRQHKKSLNICGKKTCKRQFCLLQ